MKYTVNALTACSRKAGTVDLFVGDRNGRIWHRSFQGQWSAWRQIGAMPGATAPEADWLTAIASSPDQMELFARSTEGLHHLRYAQGAWASAWVKRPFPVTDAKSRGFTAAATKPDDLHVLYTVDNEIVDWRLGTNTIAKLQAGPCRRLRAVPAIGGFELFASIPTAPAASKYLRWRFADGIFTRFDVLPGPPPDQGRFSDTFAVSGNQVMVAAGERQRLWARPLADPTWRDRGGNVSTDGDRQDILAAVATTASRTDIFALWAPAGLMHRWFDSTVGGIGDERAWSPWQLNEPFTGRPEGYTLLRPQDLVHLEVRDTGTTSRLNAHGELELFAAQSGAKLDVSFPPQHIAEESAAPSAARSAGPSRLRFPLTLNATLPLSVAGVLGAISEKPLPAPALGSALELPWRLLMELPEGAVCTVAEEPVVGAGTPPGSRATGVWQCELTNADARKPVALQPVKVLPRSHDFHQPTPLGNGLVTINDIVRKATESRRAALADRLILSSLGAWFSLSGDWPGLTWTHRAAMGRDYYVRVAQTGRLFPFGHRAVVVTSTERVFSVGSVFTSGAAAQLKTTTTLIISEPSLPFGIGEGGGHERLFPFQRATIAHQLSWELDYLTQAEMAARIFWPRRGGEAVDFAVLLQSASDTVEIRQPLMFVQDGGPSDVVTLNQKYSAGPPPSPAAVASRSAVAPGPPSSWVGRDIPLLVKRGAASFEAVIDSVQRVQTVVFAVGGAPGGGTHPKIAGLTVELPALNQLSGVTGPIAATLSEDLTNVAAEPNTLLNIAKQAVAFGNSAKTFGAVAMPSMAVNAVTRQLGPTLAASMPTANELFDDNAKLFGIIKLKDLFASSLKSKPKITWRNNAPELTWDHELTKPVMPFALAGDEPTMLTLTVESGKCQGTVTNFVLTLPVVLIRLNSVKFISEPGQRPTVEVDIKKIELVGKLSFLKTLQDSVMKAAGGGGGDIQLLPNAIKVSYTLSLPIFAVGVFTLQNLLIEAALTLSLENQPLRIDFCFGTRQRPFLVTVSGLGGGGYLELGVVAGSTDPAVADGLETFVGGLEFGASVAMSFVIVSAEVHVFGGIVFRKARDIELTGYLRIGGSVDLLGLVRVAIELTISLTYNEGTNTLSGVAKLIVVVDLTLWSHTFELTCRKSFEGPSLLAPQVRALSTPDPRTTVAATLGDDGGSYPWEIYCRAFAGA